MARNELNEEIDSKSNTILKQKSSQLIKQEPSEVKEKPMSLKERMEAAISEGTKG